ncbi:mycothiol synthase [Nocardioides perillae]|uniref:Mycothiol acetyltransferase n=1 Tax=Nocardioides perillae TaxID=1119534 RepID=A0A7Y9URP1_9ACTN|nr:mycothiol synthase [Nocardioides perillae]
MLEPDLLPADVLAHVEEVSRAAEAADGAAPLDEATWLALRHRPAADIGWWRADEAFALLVDDELSVVVAPAARRRGLGSTLLAEVAEVTEGERLTAWSHGDHPGAAVLADRFGFARVRELWVMRRDASVPLPEVVVPDGVAISGFDENAERDAADVLAVNAAAFAHHPEQGALDADGLAVRRHEPWWDPAGLLLARDTATGELLGFHWTKVHPVGDDGVLRGEVYVVGIAPAAQGRGLGGVLTLAGLHHLHGRGLGEVLLYVESDNAPAVAVYSRLGFAHAAADTHVQYARG